jgi:hypothetical protein
MALLVLAQIEAFPILKVQDGSMGINTGRRKAARWSSNVASMFKWSRLMALCDANAP